MSNYCSTCLRPNARCLCAFVRPVQNKTPVFILQHSKERQHPKGTAKLTQLCLNHCTLIADKTFHQALEEITENYRPLLLWPSKSEDAVNQTIKDAFETSPPSNGEKPTALIAIDGTWKKANKIYLSHAELQALPKLNIEGRANQYHHRKSPSDQHLSTLEAIYHGLNIIERRSEASDSTEEPQFEELLTAQQAMIEHWFNGFDRQTSTKPQP